MESKTISYEQALKEGYTNKTLLQGGNYAGVKEEDFQNWDWTNEAEPLDYLYPVPKKETTIDSKVILLERIDSLFKECVGKKATEALFLLSEVDKLYKVLGQTMFVEYERNQRSSK